MSQPGVVIQFWYDFNSPYSFLGSARLWSLSKSFSRPGYQRSRLPTLQYKPFLIGPVFQQQNGTDKLPFEAQPRKSTYMWRDVERLLTLRYGILRQGERFEKPSVWPCNPVSAARVVLALQEYQARMDNSNLEEIAHLDAHFTHRAYEHLMIRHHDLGSPEIIKSVLEETLPTQVSVDEILGLAQDPAVKSRLRKNTEEAIAAGIFGAPTFVVYKDGKEGVGEGELFWGNDRLEDAIQWAETETGARL